MEALATVEATLQAARPELKERLGGAAASLLEHHQLDAFYQTVTAAGAQQCRLRKAALRSSDLSAAGCLYHSPRRDSSMAKVCKPL